MAGFAVLGPGSEASKEISGDTIVLFPEVVTRTRQMKHCQTTLTGDLLVERVCIVVRRKTHCELDKGAIAKQSL